MRSDTVVSAVREAARSLLGSPGFSFTAVLSIGGAIGLAGAIGSVTYAAHFGKLPYPEADKLLELWQTTEPGNAQPSDYLAPVRMEEWAGTESRHLVAIAAGGVGTSLTVGDRDPPVVVTAVPIVGDWFATMGVPAARGRVLLPDDARPGAERAIVVSDRFAIEQDAELGSVLELSGTAYTIVGVMPRAFEETERVWMTLESLPAETRPVAYAGVARVRPGSTVTEATSEIQQMAAAQVAADSGLYSGLGATARPFGSMARDVGPRLWMLAGVVLAIVLVGASNLTQLFLVRIQARAPAMAVRGSLGGSRWDVGGGLAAEAMLLAAMGGALGLLLAIVGSDVVRAFIGSEYRLPVEPAVRLPIVLVIAVLTVLIAVALAAEPLRRAAALDLAGLLQRRAAGSIASIGERRTQRVMVVVQIATCVVLVAAATVLASAYRSLESLDMGYDAHAIVQANPDYGAMRMSGTEPWDLSRAIAERLRASPVVSGVAIWEHVGEDYPPRPEIDAVFDGEPRTLGTFERLARYYAVDPGFFEVLGIDVVAGRAISDIDRADQPPVAVVTRGGANAWWPGEDPLGHQVKLGQNGTWVTVVGVVDDVQLLNELGRWGAMRNRPLPLMFVPYAQMPTPPTGWRSFPLLEDVMIGARPRPSSSPDAVADLLAAEFAAIAPSLRVEIDTMTGLQVEGGYLGSAISLAARTVTAGTLVVLALALLGIVGVVREGVGRRTREIGLRVALGAGSAQVVGTAARESALTAIVGVGLGVLLIVPLDRVLTAHAFPYDVRYLSSGVLDPAPVGAAMLVVVVAATLAAVGAARRATTIDPAEVLRME